MKNLKEQDSYLIRNRWLWPVFAVILVLAAQELVTSIPGIKKIPDLILYGVAGVVFVYAGFLNAMTNTITAIIFRCLGIVGLIAWVIWFFIERFQLLQIIKIN